MQGHVCVHYVRIYLFGSKLKQAFGLNYTLRDGEYITCSSVQVSCKKDGNDLLATEIGGSRFTVSIVLLHVKRVYSTQRLPKNGRHIE